MLREGVKKKIVKFSTKRRGWIRIGQFFTKKNIGFEHSKWPKKHFRTNFIFAFFWKGGWGLFTRT